MSQVIDLTYNTFKTIASERGLKIQMIDLPGDYILRAADSWFIIGCTISKTTPANADQADFEANLLSTVNKKISDPETGAQQTTIRTVPEGWGLQQVETEFKLGTLGSIHEKAEDNSDLGYSSLKFYDASNNEITGANLNQAYLDANCKKTRLYFMPPYDYIIYGGYMAQLTESAYDVYAWTAIPYLDDAYGGALHWYSNGGVNLAYQQAKTRYGVEKDAGTLLKYTHPQLGAGKGTNRQVWSLRHDDAGSIGLRVQLICIIAKEL